MKALYDADLDYLEVIQTGVENYATSVNDDLQLFISEADGKVVGFALELASKHLEELSLIEDSVMRLAGVVRLLRGCLGISQEDLAAKTHIGQRTIQRIESGDGNTTYDHLVSLSKVAPKDFDFSVALRSQAV